MSFRFGAIDIQIPWSFGKLNNCSFEFLINNNLAAQSASSGEAES